MPSSCLTQKDFGGYLEGTEYVEKGSNFMDSVIKDELSLHVAGMMSGVLLCFCFRPPMCPLP